MPTLSPFAPARPSMRLAAAACRRVAPGASSHIPPRRPFSASTGRVRSTSDPSAAIPEAPPSRWIADLRARIGKCLTFGCNGQQINQAAEVLRVIATEWKELLAGSEGYLTGGRRGLDGREVHWGEMDTFVSPPRHWMTGISVLIC